MTHKPLISNQMSAVLSLQIGPLQSHRCSRGAGSEQLKSSNLPTFLGELEVACPVPCSGQFALCDCGFRSSALRPGRPCGSLAFRAGRNWAQPPCCPPAGADPSPAPASPAPRLRLDESKGPRASRWSAPTSGCLQDILGQSERMRSPRPSLSPSDTRFASGRAACDRPIPETL